MRLLSLACMLVMAFHAASVARAQAPQPVPIQDLSVQHSVGASFGSDLNFATTDVLLIYRYRWLAAGASLHASTQLLAANEFGAALHAGLALRLPRAHLNLLGTLGQRYDAGVGRDGILGDDPGASGGLPYAGLRFGLGYLLQPTRRMHLLLGVSCAADQDLIRITKHYSYKETDWLGDGSTSTQESVKSFGGVHVQALLTAGILFDL